ncbi:11162_t:CDS:2, partial [Diversispora eburnea]
MNHLIQDNIAGFSNSIVANMDMDTTNTQSLRGGRSKRNINTSSEVAERNGEDSLLRKRKAAEYESFGGKKKAAKKRKGKEGRAARYIKECSNDTKKRIERAIKQPIYLIGYEEINPTKQEYTVLGETGCQPSKSTVEELKNIASRPQHNRKPIDDDCPVCYEPLNNQKILVWCEGGCGKNLHQDCFLKWESTFQANRK